MEALAHVLKPTTVVELSQETPFQRSYSVINKVLNAFGAESLVTKTVNSGGSVTTVQSCNPVAFSKITKPFSSLFFEMLPQEANRKFRLFALDATSTPRIHANTLEEYEYEDTVKHQPVDVLLNRWNDVYIEGHSELVDVVKVEIFAKDDYTKTLLPPLLLILSGKRRRDITALEAYQSYRRRFDIEHFFRFVKQKLLFCAYQTPELDHQISWWWFCCMAYWLLYQVRHIGQGSTRPWHKKRDSKRPAGPGEVKRLFATRIFPVLGSPSHPPTIREKSRGRKIGTRFPKRERKKVIKKSKERLKAA